MDTLVTRARLLLVVANDVPAAIAQAQIAEAELALHYAERSFFYDSEASGAALAMEEMARDALGRALQIQENARRR